MKVKYFIRGVGIGILFAALLLFAVNRNQKVSLSDEEIMEQARNLGMMTKEEAEDARMDANLDQMKDKLTEASPSPETTKEPTVSKEPEKAEESKKPSASSQPKETDTNAKKTEKAATSKKSSGKNISITIESGMVSSSIARYLYQAGVVGSAKDFNDFIEEHDYATKIRAGEYEIPVNASYKEIIDILT